MKKGTYITSAEGMQTGSSSSWSIRQWMKKHPASSPILRAAHSMNWMRSPARYTPIQAIVGGSPPLRWTLPEACYFPGGKAGIIGFDPYRLDSTSHLHPGKNNIAVRVIGSHKNLLGPHYNHPAKGLASPRHWKGIKEPVPGDAYQLIDYGLFDDFELMH